MEATAVRQTAEVCIPIARTRRLRNDGQSIALTLLALLDYTIPRLLGDIE